MPLTRARIKSRSSSSDQAVDGRSLMSKELVPATCFSVRNPEDEAIFDFGRLWGVLLLIRAEFGGLLDDHDDGECLSLRM